VKKDVDIENIKIRSKR